MSIKGSIELNAERRMIASVDLLRDAKKNVGRVRTIILEFQNSENNESFIQKYTDPKDIQIARSVLRSGCVRSIA